MKFSFPYISLLRLYRTSEDYFMSQSGLGTVFWWFQMRPANETFSSLNTDYYANDCQESNWEELRQLSLWPGTSVIKIYLLNK